MSDAVKEPMNEMENAQEGVEVPQVKAEGEAVAESAEVKPGPLEILQTELSDSKDRFLRLAAEFENYKKISARELGNRLKFANEGLLLALLPIMDNLEQAVNAGKN